MSTYPEEEVKTCLCCGASAIEVGSWYDTTSEDETCTVTTAVCKVCGECTHTAEFQGLFTYQVLTGLKTFEIDVEAFAGGHTHTHAWRIDGRSVEESQFHEEFALYRSVLRAQVLN